MSRGFTAPSGTLYAVTASIYSTIALHANGDRAGLFFYNNTDGIAYISFAHTASSGDPAWTVRLDPSASFSDDRSRPYTGIVTVNWSAASNKNLMITEFTIPGSSGYDSF